MAMGGCVPQEMAFTAEHQSRIARMFDLPLWEEGKEQCSQDSQNQDDQRTQMSPIHPVSMQVPSLLLDTTFVGATALNVQRRTLIGF